VAKKRKPRRSRAALVALAVPLVVAVAFVFWLVNPRHGPGPTPLAELTPAAAPSTAEPEASPAPEETATATATLAAQTPSPSPAASLPALPQLTPRPNTGSSGGARLALIVDDSGQWLDTERAFIALSVPLTMSVLPDVPYTGLIQHEAAAAGKGVMLHLPMETVSGLNPGPGKVTTEMTDAQIEAQVKSDLAQVPLAEGVNNHEGSKGSSDQRVMRDVVSVLAAHGGLFFIDSWTSPDSVAQRTAAAAGIPTAGRDVFLDNQANVAYVEGQLREAAAIARRTGSAIAIGHPRPTTLEAVRALIPELQAQGIQFVLARDLVSTATTSPQSTP
jgi:uncharacterized protein